VQGLTWVGYANSVIRRGAALREQQTPNPTVNIVSVVTCYIRTMVLTDYSGTDEDWHRCRCPLQNDAG